MSSALNLAIPNEKFDEIINNVQQLAKDKNWINYVEVLNNKSSQQSREGYNYTYLPDFKRHQMRLEHGDEVAIQLENIFAEYKIETVWNFAKTKKLNAIQHIGDCYEILRGHSQDPNLINFSLDSPHLKFVKNKEDFNLEDFRNKCFENWAISRINGEIQLRWMFDIVHLSGFHNTKNGYSRKMLSSLDRAYRLSLMEYEEKNRTYNTKEHYLSNDEKVWLEDKKQVISASLKYFLEKSS